jgi:hypothetical protein
MIAPVAIAGILIMAILANQTYATSKSVSSSGEKCKTTENGNSQGEEKCKTAQEENTQGKAQESSNTGCCISLKYREPEESTFSLSNTRNAEEKANNTGQPAPVRPTITITPFQAHVTTRQLSNGLTGEKSAVSTNEHCRKTQAQASGGSLLCLPNSSSLARAVSGSGARVGGPVTAEQFGLEGFIIRAGGKSTGMECPNKTPQSVRFLNGVEYTICETKAPHGPQTEPIKSEQKAMHPSLTAFVPKCEKLEPTCEKSMHGSALTHEGPRALAKIVQKVGGETLEAGKALLGIKGK